MSAVQALRTLTPALAGEAPSAATAKAAMISRVFIGFTSNHPLIPAKARTRAEPQSVPGPLRPLRLLWVLRGYLCRRLRRHGFSRLAHRQPLPAWVRLAPG